MAIAPVAAVAKTPLPNPGIVPAYLMHGPAKAAPTKSENPGIVPPYLLHSLHSNATTKAAGAAISKAVATKPAATSAHTASKFGWDDYDGYGGDGGYGGYGDDGYGGSGYGDDSGVQASPADQKAVINDIQHAHDFFAKNYGLGARDGNGPGLKVEFDPSLNNAEYVPTQSGKEYMIVGTDQKTGASYAKAPEVIYHEYSHRIVNNVLGLNPTGESGAVNESLADTFATAISNDNNWLVGERVEPGGIRSMANPSRPQSNINLSDGSVIRMPSNINDYVNLPVTKDADNGGVHINMGIPNKAAYLIGKQLGKKTMADIYMGAIEKYMTPHSGIVDTAHATLESADSEFGRQSNQAAAVLQAWKAVGVNAKTEQVIPEH